MRISILTRQLLLGCCAASVLVGGSVPGSSAASDLAMDKEWGRLQACPPALGVREVAGFALEAAGRGEHPEQVEVALSLLERMQNRDARSETFGNFRWYWRETEPGDRNAVEFVTQQAVLLQRRFGGRLAPAGRERLEGLLRLSVEGIHRHRVEVRYTNIYLMKTGNLLALGEALHEPELAAEGRVMLDAWLDFTAKNGIHEFLSPTYYGVDLDCLALMARHLDDPEAREKAERGLNLVWNDIAGNWFAPAGRLGGAHGRDYDYLTGHGELDRHLSDAGWISGPAPGNASTFGVFAEATRWLPPAALRVRAETAVPRFVFQRWDAADEAWAAQCVGRHFSIGASGKGQGPEDKVFTVNLAGPAGPRTVMVNFFMDGRGDPYGQRKQPTGASGHSKAHHLVPYFRAVQRGPEVLFFARSPTPEARGESPSCLFSHLDLPAEARVWLGNTPAEPMRPTQRLAAGEACFLRLDDVAVGLRFLLAEDTGGRPAAVELINDGETLHARRLTVTHSAGPPGAAHGTVAVWARAAEGLDEEGFSRFREDFSRAEATVRREGDGRVVLQGVGVEGPLDLTANPPGR